MTQSAYDKAVYLLSSREHTEKELREKLRAKGFSLGDISSSIIRLKAEGYLSEERFAEVYIRSRLRKTAEGKALLLMRLREKGTPEGIASDAVEKAWAEELWKPSLRDAYKRCEAKKGREYAEMKMRQKGFTLNEIRSVRDEQQ